MEMNIFMKDNPKNHFLVYLPFFYASIILF